jgi:hypothetical protein
MVMLRSGRQVDARSQQSGAVAVEFAIVIPVLLLIVFGIIQFGIVLAQQNALNGAVRTGARFGSVNAYAGTHTCQAVIDRVEDAATTIGLGDGSAVEVTVMRGASTVCSTGAGALTAAPCENAAASPSAPETLSVSASYRSNFIVPMPLADDFIDLASEGVYQCEYQ